MERVVTSLFGPQPLGYRPAPGLWSKLVVLACPAAVAAIEPPGGTLDVYGRS
jgi:hypothetical protein